MLRVDYEETPALFVAYDDNDYDPCSRRNVMGYGRTSQEAIDDYYANLEDHNDYLASH